MPGGEPVSAAFLPPDDTIGQVARTAPVHDMDETAGRRHGARHSPPPQLLGRMSPAQCRLEGPPGGCEGERVFQCWHGLRQRCRAHLVRTATGLAAHFARGLARFGQCVPGTLPRAVSCGHGAPHWRPWRAWYARLRPWLRPHTARAGNAGTCARRLPQVGGPMWRLRDVPGVAARHNRAARAPRCGGHVPQAQSRDVSRDGQALGGADPLTTPHLSDPLAPAVPRLGRSIVLPMHRETLALNWMTHDKSLPAYSTP
jgi:hypothetical protein